MRILVQLLASALLAQNAGELNVDVSLVELGVGVYDAAGHPVRDLSPEEILVYEDGVPQNLSHFAPPGDEAVRILWLIDGEVAREAAWFQHAVADAFLDTLGAYGETMVATFHEEVRVTHPWSTLADVSLSNLVLKGWDGADVYRLGDLTLGRTTHQELWPQAGSFAFFTFRANVTSSITANRPGQKDLYGALEWAVRQADEAEGTRTLVIVLTNGSQPGMRLRGAPGGGFRIADAEDDGDFRDVLDSVRRSGREVYVFAVDTDVNPLSLSSLEFWVQRRPMAIYDLQQARSRFEELARVSGGRVVYPRSFEDLVPMLQGLAREAFRTAYSLGYAPAEQEGERDRYREIEVRVARPGVTVRQSRSGYDPAARPE